MLWAHKISAIIYFSVKLAETFSVILKGFGTTAVKIYLSHCFIQSAIYLLPHRSAYGPWPNSGQMTFAQSRGNAMYLVDGEPMGTQRMEMALQFGPGIGGFIKQHINSKEEKGWDNDFHEYELEWTPGK